MKKFMKRPLNHRSAKLVRPGDYYATPKSLVWVSTNIILAHFDQGIPVLEPCSGEGAISEELEKLGYRVMSNDLFRGGTDYLDSPHLYGYTQVITNPPFRLWNEFVLTCKSHCDQGRHFA